MWKNYQHNVWLKGRQKNHSECMNMNKNNLKLLYLMFLKKRYRIKSIILESVVNRKKENL